MTIVDKPKVGDTDYESKLISSFNSIDNHDHDTGNGEPVAAIAASVADNSTIDQSAGKMRVKPASLGLNKFAGLGPVPVGTILPYVGTSAPTGWLLCDGTAVSRTTYAALYAVIGDAWGYGDNLTTFNVPDTRGVFLRGRANGSSNDPDRLTRQLYKTGGASGDSVGSYQADEIKQHTHSGALTTGIRGRWNDGKVGVGGHAFGSVRAMSTSSTNGLTAGTYKEGTANANESRPVNIAVNYIVKY